MSAAPHPQCTLTLMKRHAGPAPASHWELQCEGESLGEFDSLNEALAMARTLAAHWLGEAETVRLVGGDFAAVVSDDSYSRLPARLADNDPA